MQGFELCGSSEQTPQPTDLQHYAVLKFCMSHLERKGFMKPKVVQALHNHLATSIVRLSLKSRPSTPPFTKVEPDLYGITALKL